MLLIVPLLAFLAVRDGDPPDPAKLIRDAIAVYAEQEKKNEKFTYREDEERPNEKTKTYDVIMLEGANYRKLILIDGQPLDAKTAKKVDQDLEKTREARKHPKTIGFHKTIENTSLEHLSRLFDNKVTGEEVVNGRKAWRVESDAKPGAKGATPAEEEILATRRVTWFDEGDGAEVRSSTTFVRNAHQIQAGNQTDVESTKIGDTWQITAFSFHPNVKFMPGFHITGSVHYRYYDFKRFSADSTFIPEPDL